MSEVTLDQLVDWLSRTKAVVTDNREYLTELDSAIGDADHGSNLTRGFTAVVDKLSSAPPADIAAMLQSAGMTLVSTVGGASGPLYGTFLLRMGKAIGPVESASAAALGAGLRAGLEGIVTRGKAELGDKTLVDALTPAVDAYDTAVAAGESAAAAAAAAASAAGVGRDATEPLVARKGRASYLGERSAGHIDPGSASVTMVLESLAQALGADAG